MVPDPNVPDWRAAKTRWYPATFIKCHKGAAPYHEDEFRWFECTDGIIYGSQSSILPPLFLRRFTRSRKFCEEIAEVDLTAKQVGKVRLPFYIFPEHPDHKNPELEEVFEAAIQQVAKILVDFDPGHPVIENFTKYFKSVKGVERCRQRQERVSGVGTVLLQLLAVQEELDEPLNLNGDISEDLITGRVISCLSDGQSTGKFRPPTFRREGPSIFTPTTAIPVTLTLKRKASEKIEGERRAKKRAPRTRGLHPVQNKVRVEQATNGATTVRALRSPTVGYWRASPRWSALDSSPNQSSSNFSCVTSITHLFGTNLELNG
ncbi:hypothetical protein K438DRAFT_1747209 [Mycena galopus ATCC 62051]|nr:hypothetical protein K438DRAFT_1747209 [Mycena galopus ATCC 62051]